MSGVPSRSPADLPDYAHFRVLRRPDGTPWLLGSGGMGMTYKAHDTRLRVDVALKVINPARLGDPDARRLFIREARAAARVNHPNIASVVFLDDGVGGRAFYAMEFVDGTSLHEWLKQHGRARAGLALAFAEQLASALGAIHEAGIVHRDLKPGNIMVIRYPPEHPRHRALAASGGHLLKIIDFGLARGGPAAEGDPTEATVGFRGTAAYSSPEQCDERPGIDGRSDFYSLGCILWELLAGVPPFTGRSGRELINDHVTTAPPWTSLAHLPPAVVKVLRSLLAKDPRARFPSSSEAGDAMTAARLALPPVTTETPLPAPSRGLSLMPSTISVILAPGWWRAAAAIAAVLLLLVGALFVFGMRRKAGLPEPTADDAAQRRRVVAVLPFVNRSAEGDTQHFAEGVHEDILTSLAKVRALRVISVKSATKTRDGRDEPRDLAREFGAGSVLEGSVRRQGTRIRVATQLNDTVTGRQIWADSFDRELTDTFEIQSAVAREIARSLEMKLSSGETTSIARQPTKIREAQELFLRARSLQRRATRSREVQFDIVRQFEAVLLIDPKFALAAAHLSRAHSLIFLFGIDRSPERAAIMRQTAERALDLEPGLPEAHVAMGRVLSYAGRQHEAALREYQVALAIEPGNSEAQLESGYVLRRLNRWQDALRAHRQASELEPDDPEKLNSLGTCLFSMRRYREAREIYGRAVAISDNPFRQLNVLLADLELSGDWEAFRRGTREIIPNLPPDQRWRIQRNIGDFRGALQTVATLPGDDLGVIGQRLPKVFIEAGLRRLAGDTDGALAAWPEACSALRLLVAAAPADGALRMKLALALAGAREWKAAIAEGTEALNAFPESADSIVHRELQAEFAQICAETGDAARATTIAAELLKREMPLTRQMLRHFPEWATLRGFPAFDALIAERL